jgi:hypothetical protein
VGSNRRTKCALKIRSSFALWRPRKKKIAAYGVSRFQLMGHASPQAADSTMSLILHYGSTHSCNGHSLANRANRKDPPLFGPRDESLPLQRLQSQTSERWNLRRRSKSRAAPRTGNGMAEHRSVFHPAITGEMPPWLRHARTMSTWSLPFARVTREA